mmetsp:Transcript_118641/g.295868  ORF Transcript_118641/g.295868 Transcript_118641/m.295868 type:complete len:154 (+) Transcript_118641:55-516(+)|eukprot:CAMPEP_0115463136 /NCGR_PEP_ID=MMETSP0271-20121206/48186_1 /TAXON_ID=71861 /ORGANISM="Scrippsiella trochoidea, Strain CCMP3099" /LENGTH=153 /DNA_ID=CAMNT_0002889949 /DNA_START=56 /DNA_END=517 /DNA_ORIENTATION=-
MGLACCCSSQGVQQDTTGNPMISSDDFKNDKQDDDKVIVDSMKQPMASARQSPEVTPEALQREMPADAAVQRPAPPANESADLTAPAQASGANASESCEVPEVDYVVQEGADPDLQGLELENLQISSQPNRMAQTRVSMSTLEEFTSSASRYR